MVPIKISCHLCRYNSLLHSVVAWALAHCDICIDPQKPKFIEKPAILNLIFMIELINKISISDSHFEEEYWNFKL